MDAAQARQASAFDAIGERYDEAFPHKDGQIAAGEWLLKRLARGARVLDVGCGTGVPTARQLVNAGRRVVGIDPSEGMLRLATRNVPGADFLAMDAASIGPALGTFDAVTAFFSLLMLPREEIPAALRAIHGVLKPGGYLTIGMVEGDLDYVPISFLGQQLYVTAYPQEQLWALLSAERFDVLEMNTKQYAPVAPDSPPEVQLFMYCRSASSSSDGS